MARTTTVPEREYTPGVYGPFELRSLPGNAEGYRISFTRVNWPAGPVATIQVEWSRDNAGVWQPLQSTSLGGGILYDKLGNVLPASWIAQTWPGEADGQGGRTKLRGTDVRVTATVLQTLRTAITVEAL